MKEQGGGAWACRGERERERETGCVCVRVQGGGGWESGKETLPSHLTQRIVVGGEGSGSLEGACFFFAVGIGCYESVRNQIKKKKKKGGEKKDDKELKGWGGVFERLGGFVVHI